MTNTTVAPTLETALLGGGCFWCLEAVFREVEGVERAGTFWPAEVEHQEYYAHNSDQPYCQYVVAPKVAKFRDKFGARRKGAGH